MNLILLQRATYALIVVTVCLVLLLVLGSVGNIYQAQARTPRRAVPNLDDAPTDLPDVQKYLSIAQGREMFKQSVVYETKKGPTVNILEGIQFLGVTKRGQSVRAVLFNSKTGVSSSYAPGEMMGDLKIDEIRDDRVILSHGAEKLELIR
ncbi:MAG: hypothetical protein ABFD69_10470 [Candidatus Sumerlaeia bacterium]